MKICKNCNIEKTDSEFYFDSSNSCLHSKCKKCILEDSKAKYRTKEGFIKKLLNTQNKKSVERNHSKPSYSYDELADWLEGTEFDSLFTKWEDSEYNKLLAPSIDRLDDYKPYSLDNIRVVTWQENKAKWHRDAYNGVNNKQNMSVLKYTKDMALLEEYYSISSASRDTGTCKGDISKVCNGKLKSAGGYIWKYKGLDNGQ